ncbi:MAG: ferritin-like domain-containing protein [Rudaea sp.]
MNALSTSTAIPTREQLIYSLCEAAELEHCLMLTYLYAAFSLKTSGDEGLSEPQLEAVTRWRGVILGIATEEMGHLLAVWNITSALGGTPRVGRPNFPLDPGFLPAGVVVKLAPFDMETLQHFVYLERPGDSDEHDAQKFAPERQFSRAVAGPRLTPMGMDYDTVGDFYKKLGENLSAFVSAHGEKAAFCGDPTLQLSSAETQLRGVSRVICLKTALGAFDSIIAQGEGASEHSDNSHYQRFAQIRTEYETLLAADAAFNPAFPAATNPVLRRPPRPEGKVWLENPDAIATADLANGVYGLMLRLLAYAFAVPSADPDKAVTIDLAIGLMHALLPLGERAARLPAGPSNPSCNAGVSFITLRDAVTVPAGVSARRFFRERLDELVDAASNIASDDRRTSGATSLLSKLAQRAQRDFDVDAPATKLVAQPVQPIVPPPVSVPTQTVAGIEEVEGRDLTLVYEGKRCIHARFCVTGAPTVFLANVQGPWIHPDTVATETLVEVAHVCPSGAIRYRRRDGHADESPPPVNLAAVREAGPYAIRGDIRIDGLDPGFRATLCRCGASKNKPYCDGSHHDIKFAASGEPATDPGAEMLPVRNGPLQIDPQPNGPLQVRGNLEITSGTGRMVARTVLTKLCRCGGSQNKPFCDGTHVKIGFVAP